jgi:hypothetical protein
LVAKRRQAPDLVAKRRQPPDLVAGFKLFC